MSRAQAVIRRAVTQPSATWSPISIIKEAADKQRVSCVFAESQVPVPLGQFAIFKYTVMWQGQVRPTPLAWCLNTAVNTGTWGQAYPFGACIMHACCLFAVTVQWIQL